jgi:DNA-binding protein H-NS
MATQKSVEALMAELEAIQAQIKDKKSEVIADIKKKIELFSIIPSDLFAPYSPPSEKQGKQPKSQQEKSAVKPKYRHPDGTTWSGRGMAPKWMMDDKGNKKEEYLIKDE